MLSCRSWASSSTAQRYYGRGARLQLSPLCVRRLRDGLVLAVGTVGFRLAIHESWLQSFYRAVVSSTLTGLDTVPRNDAARIVTIFLVLAGISIFAYIGSLVVEAIARGVIGGVWGEGKGRRGIQAVGGPP